MGIARTVAKNSLVIMASSVTTKILSLIFTISVARYLGVAGFGKYSFVFALMAFFIVFIGFGMDTLVIREVSKDKLKSSLYLVNAIALKTMFSALSWLLLFAVVLVLRKDGVTNFGIFIIGLCLLPDSIVASFKAVFSAHQRMEYNTLLEICFRLVVVILGLASIYFKQGLQTIFLVSICASIVTLVSAAGIYTRVIGIIKTTIDYGLCKHLLGVSVIFLLAGIFVSIYRQLDIVLLSAIKGDAVVGYYSAARGVTDALLFIPAAICGAVFPVFSRIQHESKASFQLAYTLSYKVLLLLALPIALSITVLADRIILLIYKASFINSVIPLKILIWTTFFGFLNIVMTIALYSVNKEKVTVGIVFTMAVLSFILNLSLIPKYSYIGTSLVSIFTEMSGFIICSFFVAKYICRPRFGSTYLKSFLSASVMAAFLHLFKSYNLFILILAGALIYVGMLFLLGVFTQEDKKYFKEIIFQREVT